MKRNEARAIAENIEAELNSRGGFDTLSLDDEIREDMLTLWAGIIHAGVGSESANPAPLVLTESEIEDAMSGFEKWLDDGDEHDDETPADYWIGRFNRIQTKHTEGK